MTCKHLMRSEADCVFCQRDQIRGTLTLAEEGLANYAQENERLKGIEQAAERLLSCVQEKGEPWDSEHNQKLRDMGDTIAVSEGNLWLLLAALQAIPHQPQTQPQSEKS